MDRRIAITYTTTTVGRDGSPVTETATLEVWARKMQDSVARTLAGQGGYATAARSYRGALQRAAGYGNPGRRDGQGDGRRI